MSRRVPTDEELIRYLEGEATQSKAGQIILLTSAHAAERARLDALEHTLGLLAQPDERVAEIDLVAAIRDRIDLIDRTEAAAPSKRKRAQGGFMALCAVISMGLVLSLPVMIRQRSMAQPPQPEPHRHQMERTILGWLALEQVKAPR